MWLHLALLLLLLLETGESGSRSTARSNELFVGLCKSIGILSSETLGTARVNSGRMGCVLGSATSAAESLGGRLGGLRAGILGRAGGARLGGAGRSARAFDKVPKARGASACTCAFTCAVVVVTALAATTGAAAAVVVVVTEECEGEVVREGEGE